MMQETDLPHDVLERQRTALALAGNKNGPYITWEERQNTWALM